MNNSPPKPVEPPGRHHDETGLFGPSITAPPGERAAYAPRRIGDFTIVRVLGEGGMGTVYLAEDARLRRKAAIKTMKPELAARPENRERFLREAQAAAAIEHDNVVPIWQVGESDGGPFIAMPLLRGETLESRLDREPVPALALTLKVACDVAEGLAAAHAAGLTHRDVKASNVWLEGDPAAAGLERQVRRCKILDFGLAHSVESQDVRITGSGTILGTPAYMAPEQARAEDVDHRADLFSLGVMLYRMTTGKLPFAGPNVMAVLTALATAAPPPARALNLGVPPALSDLIARLMSKDPAGRPRSALDVAAEVRRIAKGLRAGEPEGAGSLGQRGRASVGSAGKGAEDTLSVEPEQVPPRAKAWRGRAALLIALALLALVPLGAWLAAVVLRVETASGTLVVDVNGDEVEARIKGGRLVLTGPDGKARYTLSPAERDKEIEAGAYKVRVEGADGLTLDTTEFTLKKGDKVTVRVTVDPRAARNLDPDRKAAEWVLSIGGRVWVNDDEGGIKAAADLPKEKFRLTGVDLTDNRQAGDEGLAHFKGCKDLKSLSLGRTRVGDAGLAHFRGCKGLTQLWLFETQVTDKGLAHFEGYKSLTSLNLHSTQVGDAGLAHFKNCKDLKGLVLARTKVGDGGLAHFEGCKGLSYLDLGGTPVTDEGLAFFKDCKGLTGLGLASTPVGNAGLAHFKGCKGLTLLSLGDTRAGDAGLAHFRDCKGLTYLDLGRTQVTDEGLESFKDCKELDFLNLHGTQVKGAGLAHFRDCKGLTHLTLSWNKLGDEDLAHFKDCKGLSHLDLGVTQVSDEGLAHFKECKGLTYLDLGGTRAGDAGVAHFKGCKGLTHLNLGGTRVGNGGLAHFGDCKNLTQLYLYDTRVTDAGLAHFEGCKGLTHLRLEKTKVTAAKVEELRKALPGCKIEWDGGVIEPTER